MTEYKGLSSGWRIFLHVLAHSGGRVKCKGRTQCITLGLFDFINHCFILTWGIFSHFFLKYQSVHVHLRTLRSKYCDRWMDGGLPSALIWYSKPWRNKCIPPWVNRQRNNKHACPHPLVDSLIFKRVCSFNCHTTLKTKTKKAMR